jgi:hypothetical protein
MTFKEKRDAGDTDPELLRKLRHEFFPEVPEHNGTLAVGDLKDRLQVLAEKREQLEALKRKLQALKEQKGQGAPGTENGHISDES